MTKRGPYRPRLAKHKRIFISNHYKYYTVNELAKATNEPQQTIRYFLKKFNLKPWPAKMYRDEDYQRLTIKQPGSA